MVGFNAVIPFLLALKRYSAFGREELLVYNSVHFIVLEKSLGEGLGRDIGNVCATRFFTKKVSLIMVSKGKKPSTGVRNIGFWISYLRVVGV